MYHTSPNKIVKGSIHDHGIAGCCLFFSSEIYRMSAESTYIYEANFNCIERSQPFDEEIIAQIADYFDVDTDTAEALLDGSKSEWDLDTFDTDGEDSWHLQGLRGQCAAKMGYDGCEDEDEQGTVYIVPMKGRESELTLIEG